MFAAQDIGLISRDELQDYINIRHVDIFDKTLAERRQAQKARGLPKTETEYDAYDTPAWIQKKIEEGFPQSRNNTMDGPPVDNFKDDVPF